MAEQNLYDSQLWHIAGNGPRYHQLARHIGAAIRSGLLQVEQQLPPERELAELADVSRVTVRKAVAELVNEGLVDQRRGAGSFIRAAAPRLEQSLSTLISFTENMTARGKTSTSVTLSQGLFIPTPNETFMLGLNSGDKVARIRRLRSADGVPMAIETSALPADVLPAPEQVDTSLYAVLRRHRRAPTRAVQRVTAVSLNAADAALLDKQPGEPVLQIDRTGYLSSGRPIEFTNGVYLPDMYDFVSELRVE